MIQSVQNIPWNINYGDDLIFEIDLNRLWTPGLALPAFSYSVPFWKASSSRVCLEKARFVYLSSGTIVNMMKIIKEIKSS